MKSLGFGLHRHYQALFQALIYIFIVLSRAMEKGVIFYITSLMILPYCR